MKTLQNKFGVYYVSDDSEDEEFLEVDPESMLESSEDGKENPKEELRNNQHGNAGEGKDVVTINSEEYRGTIENFLIKDDRISGKRIIKLIIRV